MSQTLDSSLLYKRADGTEAFVHDTLADFFLATSVANQQPRLEDAIALIKSPEFYRFLAELSPDQDGLVTALAKRCFAFYVDPPAMRDLNSGWDRGLVSAVWSSDNLKYDVIERIFLEYVEMKSESQGMSLSRVYFREILTKLFLVDPESVVGLLTQDTVDFDEHILGCAYEYSERDPTKITPRFIDALLSYIDIDKSSVQRFNSCFDILKYSESETIYDYLTEIALSEEVHWWRAAELLSEVRGNAEKRLSDLKAHHPNDVAKGRVLLLSNNSTICVDRYAGCLFDHGYQPVFTMHVAEAARHVTRHPLDLVIIHNTFSSDVMEFMKLFKTKYKGEIVFSSFSAHFDTEFSQFSVLYQATQDVRSDFIPLVEKHILSRKPYNMADDIQERMRCNHG